MELVAILTPTYNRVNYIQNLYESLKKQTSKNFRWYVVDDGSTDDTEDLIKKFINERKIKIQYIKKQNGGKHTAINIGLTYIKEVLTMIVDSDDILTIDAINTIENDYVRIMDDEMIAGIGYLKLDKNNEIIGRQYSLDGRIDNFVQERINRNTYGDKCEVFKSAVLKKYPFPQFEGEKFLSEATVWCKVSLDYKMLFLNKGIYCCEYLSNGLSSSIHKTLYYNPKGAMECYRIMSGRQTNLKYRVKYTIAFATYAFIAKMKLGEQFKKVYSKLTYLLTFWIGFIVYLKKRKKFEKEKRIA